MHVNIPARTHTRKHMHAHMHNYTYMHMHKRLSGNHVSDNERLPVLTKHEVGKLEYKLSKMF